MTTVPVLRHLLVIGLALAPLGLATAQEADRDNRPPADRRPDAEPMRRQAERMRRQFEQMQRRMPNDMRGFRWRMEPGGRMMFDPEQFDSWSRQFMPGQEGHGLGLTLRPVPEVLRDHIDLPEGRGLVVDEIADDSPASGAIEPNDILLSLGETPLEDPADLAEALRKAEGETLSITLLRKGEEQTVEIDRPSVEDSETGGERYLLGVTIETPDEAVRDQLGLPEGQGVIVMAVASGSAAEKAGVQANDILLKFGDDPIVGARELADQVQANGDEPAELTLLRDGEETTVEVTPEKRPGSPRPSDAPRPPAGLRFFGPGIMIDPETGEIRPGPGRGPAGPRPFRDFPAPPSASPEMERQLDEVLEQLKQLREEVETLKQLRPGRSGRNDE